MAGQINKSAHRSWRRRGAGLILTVMLGLQAAAAIAANEQLLTVRVKEGQSLRDLAQEYLGDPDLWTEILRANGLTAGDVRAGTELKIPAGQIAEANKALGKALSLIQQATEQGARLFAAEQIGQAIKLRDAAIAQRKAGDWDAVVKLVGGRRGRRRCRFEGCPRATGCRRRRAAQRSPGLGRGSAAAGPGVERPPARRDPDRGREGQDALALDRADHV